jgi:diguanylate cyclase (GGDEF)-like protein
LALLLVKRKRPFDHSEANPMLLGALAEHISITFHNALLYRLAVTDELTQLFTVRHFQNRIEESVLECQRHQQKVGLLMLDIDHFKAINDQWGHPAGDEVLRQVARQLASTIRVVDGAYRYGGDELAILLPGRDLAAARGVAERVRQGVEGLKIPLKGGGNIAVTVSAGIAIYPDDGTSAQELVAAADAALYEAKRGGRNRVSDLLRAA